MRRKKNTGTKFYLALPCSRDSNKVGTAEESGRSFCLTCSPQDYYCSKRGKKKRRMRWSQTRARSASWCGRHDDLHPGAVGTKAIDTIISYVLSIAPCASSASGTSKIPSTPYQCIQRQCTRRSTTPWWAKSTNTAKRLEDDQRVY